MRIHGTTQARPGGGVRRRGAAAAAAGAGGALRRADLRDREGASRPSHRGRQGALLGPGQPDRRTGSRCAPTGTLVRVFPRGQLVKVHPRQPPGGRVTDPDDLPSQQDRRTRCATSTSCSRLAAGHGPAIGAYADGAAGHPVAVDQDAPGLRPAGPGQEVGPRPGRRRLRAAALDARGGQRRAHRPDARTRHRAHRPSSRRCPAPSIAGRFARDPDHFAVGAPRHDRRRQRSPRRSPRTPDERADRHPRAQGAAAPGEARPLPRHPPRTPRARPAPAAWATPSSSSSSSPTRSPAARPPPPTGAPAPPGSTRR